MMVMKKLTFETLKDITLSKEAVVYDLIRNWEKKVKPHLESADIIEALKIGFDDHFVSKEELEEYPWKEPRLDSFGAIGFSELHEIMDNETFKEYIGEDYDAYFNQLNRDWEEDEEEEEYRDWIKDQSYFAYRALNRCHHLAPFCVELGKKIKPQYEWYLFETPAHSNAIGVKNGEIHLIVDLLWGENEKNPQHLLGRMFDLSFTFLKNQTKERFTEDMFNILKQSIEDLKKQLIG